MGHLPEHEAEQVKVSGL